MRLKHWQGYGIVNATKISDIKKTDDVYGQSFGELRIRVKGNHEWGLETDDDYTIYHWLVKRFNRSINYNDIIDVKPHSYYFKDGNSYLDVCDYTILYKL